MDRWEGKHGGGMDGHLSGGRGRATKSVDCSHCIVPSGSSEERGSPRFLPLSSLLCSEKALAGVWGGSAVAHLGEHRPLSEEGNHPEQRGGFRTGSLSISEVVRV